MKNLKFQQPTDLAGNTIKAVANQLVAPEDEPTIEYGLVQDERRLMEESVGLTKVSSMCAGLDIYIYICTRTRVRMKNILL